jgi:sporulation protein YlmC with PRC-barrel domain
MAAVREFSGEELLRFPVRLDGLDVGRAVDVILDPGHSRALGVEVLCRDESHRFLPLGAAEFGDKEIRLSSAFALLDAAGFEFYRGRTSSLRSLKGTQVARRGRKLGELRDVLLSRDGEIEAFVVQSGDGSRAIAAEPGVKLDGDGRNGSG